MIPVRVTRKLILVVAVVAALGAFAATQQDETVIVRPSEITDVLVNPGMGVQTFQRFNGQALNALHWSEEGPTAPLPAAASPPDFPASSISYCRWFWQALEPEQGHMQWQIVDQALEQARAHGQRLAIRLMPYDQGHPLPEWYRKSGARRANKDTDSDGKIWQPDFSDPIYLKDWGAVVAAAGERYDGHPDLDTVDISSVGYWGEGWSDYMPAFSYQKALIDIYFDAFKRTPLLMNFDQKEALAYATHRGAGWRADCWGDMRSSTGARWSHMLDFYPIQIAEAQADNAWQHAPVSLESCGVPLHWAQHHWDINYILAQALRWHVTSVNIKSSPVPAEWRTAFDEFQRKMGYRLVLRRLEYPPTVRAGSMLPLQSWWLNAGVAPPYRDYVLAFQFSSAQASTVARTGADVRSWLPGDAVFNASIYVPETLPFGSYRLRTALLDPRTLAPAIRLAISGRQSDGWYDLGAISIVR